MDRAMLVASRSSLRDEPSANPFERSQAREDPSVHAVRNGG